MKFLNRCMLIIFLVANLLECKKTKDYIILFKKPTNVNAKVFEPQIYAEHTARILEHFTPEDSLNDKLLNGYIATMSDDTKEKVMQDEGVALVEEDGEINIAEIFDDYVKIDNKRLTRGNFYNNHPTSSTFHKNLVKTKIPDENFAANTKNIVRDANVYLNDGGIDTIGEEIKGSDDPGSSYSEYGHLSDYSSDVGVMMDSESLEEIVSSDSDYIENIGWDSNHHNMHKLLSGSAHSTHVANKYNPLLLFNGEKSKPGIPSLEGSADDLFTQECLYTTETLNDSEKKKDNISNDEYFMYPVRNALTQDKFLTVKESKENIPDQKPVSHLYQDDFTPEHPIDILNGANTPSSESKADCLKDEYIKNMLINLKRNQLDVLRNESEAVKMHKNLFKLLLQEYKLLQNQIKADLYLQNSKKNSDNAFKNIQSTQKSKTLGSHLENEKIKSATQPYRKNDIMSDVKFLKYFDENINGNIERPADQVRFDDKDFYESNENDIRNTMISKMWDSKEPNEILFDTQSTSNTSDDVVMNETDLISVDEILKPRTYLKSTYLDQNRLPNMTYHDDSTIDSNKSGASPFFHKPGFEFVDSKNIPRNHHTNTSTDHQKKNKPQRNEHKGQNRAEFSPITTFKSQNNENEGSNQYHYSNLIYSNHGADNKEIKDTKVHRLLKKRRPNNTKHFRLDLKKKFNNLNQHHVFNDKKPEFRGFDNLLSRKLLLGHSIPKIGYLNSNQPFTGDLEKNIFSDMRNDHNLILEAKNRNKFPQIFLNGAQKNLNPNKITDNFANSTSQEGSMSNQNAITLGYDEVKNSVSNFINSSLSDLSSADFSNNQTENDIQEKLSNARLLKTSPIDSQNYKNIEKNLEVDDKILEALWKISIIEQLQEKNDQKMRTVFKGNSKNDEIASFNFENGHEDIMLKEKQDSRNSLYPEQNEYQNGVFLDAMVDDIVKKQLKSLLLSTLFNNDRNRESNNLGKPHQTSPTKNISVNQLKQGINSGTCPQTFDFRNKSVDEVGKIGRMIDDTSAIHTDAPQISVKNIDGIDLSQKIQQSDLKSIVKTLLILAMSNKQLHMDEESAKIIPGSVIYTNLNGNSTNPYTSSITNHIRSMDSLQNLKHAAASTLKNQFETKNIEMEHINDELSNSCENFNSVMSSILSKSDEIPSVSLNNQVSEEFLNRTNEVSPQNHDQKNKSVAKKMNDTETGQNAKDFIKNTLHQNSTPKETHLAQDFSPNRLGDPLKGEQNISESISSHSKELEDYLFGIGNSTKIDTKHDENNSGKDSIIKAKKEDSYCTSAINEERDQSHSKMGSKCKNSNHLSYSNELDNQNNLKAELQIKSSNQISELNHDNGRISPDNHELENAESIYRNCDSIENNHEPTDGLVDEFSAVIDVSVKTVDENDSHATVSDIMKRFDNIQQKIIEDMISSEMRNLKFLDSNKASLDGNSNSLVEDTHEIDGEKLSNHDGENIQNPKCKSKKHLEKAIILSEFLEESNNPDFRRKENVEYDVIKKQASFFNKNRNILDNENGRGLNATNAQQDNNLENSKDTSFQFKDLNLKKRFEQDYQTFENISKLAYLPQSSNEKSTHNNQNLQKSSDSVLNKNIDTYSSLKRPNDPTIHKFSLPIFLNNNHEDDTYLHSDNPDFSTNKSQFKHSHQNIHDISLMSNDSNQVRIFVESRDNFSNSNMDLVSQTLYDDVSIKKISTEGMNLNDSKDHKSKNKVDLISTNSIFKDFETTERHRKVKSEKKSILKKNRKSAKKQNKKIKAKRRKVKKSKKHNKKKLGDLGGDHSSNDNKGDISNQSSDKKQENMATNSNNKIQIMKQKSVTWGLSRISHEKPHSKNEFIYPKNAGKDVDIYIIDTGIQIDHPDFENRARFGVNLLEGTEDTDDHGHGTHCAGTAAGKTVGIAKEANLIAVKALDAEGRGRFSTVILGIDWVIRDHLAKQEKMEAECRKEFLLTKNCHQKARNPSSSENKIQDSANHSGQKTAHIMPLRNKSSYSKNSVTNIFETPHINLNTADSNIPDAQNIVVNEDKYEDSTAEISSELNEINHVISSKPPPSNFLKDLTKYLKSKRIQPRSVVNVSLGGSKSRAINFAIEYGTNLGVHFVVAAGNDHEDACGYSPGSSAKALTVGASTSNDTIAFFSNNGDCVDIYAPGASIYSTWINSGYKILNGTSMASPHGAGVVATYLSLQNKSPQETFKDVIRDGIFTLQKQDKMSAMNLWPLRMIFGQKKRLLLNISKLIERLEENNL